MENFLVSLGVMYVFQFIVFFYALFLNVGIKEYHDGISNVKKKIQILEDRLNAVENIDNRSDL